MDQTDEDWADLRPNWQREVLCELSLPYQGPVVGQVSAVKRSCWDPDDSTTLTGGVRGGKVWDVG